MQNNINLIANNKIGDYFDNNNCTYLYTLHFGNFMHPYNGKKTNWRYATK